MAGFTIFSYSARESRAILPSGFKVRKLPSSLLSSPELNKLAEEMSYINTANMKASIMQPISSLIENQNSENLSDILNYHIIKWCKLYLDDSDQVGRCQIERKVFIVHGNTLLHLIQRSVK